MTSIITSFFSLITSSLASLFRTCSEKKTGEKLIKTSEETSKKNLQTDCEMNFMQRRADLKKTRPNVLRIGNADSDKYIQAFFDLLYDEYNCFQSTNISEDAWNTMKKDARDDVEHDRLTYQTAWKTNDTEYEHSFVSVVNHEILTN